MDPDLPTRWEGRMFRTVPTKMLFILFQPLFYALRPLVTMPKVMGPMEFVALFAQIAFDFSILHCFGWKALCYLFLSTLLGTPMS